MEFNGWKSGYFKLLSLYGKITNEKFRFFAEYQPEE